MKFNKSIKEKYLHKFYVKIIGYEIYLIGLNVIARSLWFFVYKKWLPIESPKIALIDLNKAAM